MEARPISMTVTLTGGATWDTVTIPASRCWSLQARTNVDIKVTEQADGDPYFTLKAGGVLDSPNTPGAVGTTLYANGTAAVVVEVLYFTR
jgi:hypothetical protein